MLVRHGIRLRPVKIAVIAVTAVIVLSLTNIRSQFTCSSINDFNRTHIYLDGRSYILKDSIIQEHQVDKVTPTSTKIDESQSALVPSSHFTIVTVQRALENTSSQTKPLYSEHFKRELISDRESTAHNRPWGTIEDICDMMNYGDLSKLPKVSVIVTFHNTEKLSNLLGTVHSILQRTPQVMLQEIILIADNVRKEDLTDILDRYIAAMESSIIKILRSPYQLGLIKARLWGIRSAQAPIVVCMDSHMELQKRWLEPLVWEIHKNKKTLAAPYLDWMEYNEDSGKWKITHGASTWKTYFDWNFVFGFQDMSERDRGIQSTNVTVPVNCPVTIGTVFAIDKAWFTSVGEFDEEMEAWGGENIDLPIRVWLFGGRVVNVPCSHTAHYEAPNSRAYRTGWDSIINRNYKRVVEVWLDDYKKYFYYNRPNLKTIDAGNLTSRLELKKKALYKFDWILQNVYPELGMHDVNTFGHSGVQNIWQKTCLLVIGLNNPTLTECDLLSGMPRQGFYWNMKGELRFPIHIFNVGMDNQFKRPVLKTLEMISSYQSAINSVWFHWEKGPLIEAVTGLCLEAVTAYSIEVNPCNFTSQTQKWSFSVYSAEYHDLINSAAGTKFKSAYLQTLHTVIKAAQSEDWVSLTQTVKNYNGIPLPLTTPFVENRKESG